MGGRRRSQVGSLHRTQEVGEEASCSVSEAAVAVGYLLSLLQVLDQASPSPFSPGIPEETCGVEARADSRGSGSQQQPCSRPLEPQEGDQASGEGGRKGVKQLL